MVVEEGKEAMEETRIEREGEKTAIEKKGDFWWRKRRKERSE